MQGGRSASAVEAAREAAANVGASAWAGKEKTKAVVQETAAKARAHGPAEKAAADARMQERVREVEAAKQDAMRRNAAAKDRASAAGHHPTPLGVGAAAGAAGGAPVAATSTGTGMAAKPPGGGGGGGGQRDAGFHGTDGVAVAPPTGTAGGHYT